MLDTLATVIRQYMIDIAQHDRYCTPPSTTLGRFKEYKPLLQPPVVLFLKFESVKSHELPPFLLTNALRW